MNRRGSNARERGFAMLSVLWAVVIVSTLVLATTIAGRDAFDAGRNRANVSRAYWSANDCAERARLVIDNALARTDVPPERAWRDLDAIVHADPLAAGSACETTLEATGTRLDVNAASPEELARLFTALGRQDAFLLVDAVEDWRDADDDVLPNGAEAAWYAAAHRPSPRNAPFMDDAEVSRVRGLEDGATQRYLTVEPGPICIPTASAPVLLSLPGVTDEMASAIIAMRAQGQQIEDLAAFSYSLSSAARDSLLTHFQEISRRTTLNPEAWIVTASARSGYPAVEARVELRLLRTNRRAVVVRRRVRQ